MRQKFLFDALFSLRSSDILKHFHALDDVCLWPIDHVVLFRFS